MRLLQFVFLLIATLLFASCGTQLDQLLKPDSITLDPAGFIVVEKTDTNGTKYNFGFNPAGDTLFQWTNSKGVSIRLIRSKKGSTKVYYLVDKTWVLWNTQSGVELDTPLLPPGPGVTIPPSIAAPPQFTTT